MTEKRINYSISVLRIIACVCVVYYHTLSVTLQQGENWLLDWHVPLFFFMSGYLHSIKTVERPGKWFVDNSLKIMKTYWVYLLFIIPVIFVLDRSRLSIVKIVAAFLGLQGLGGEGRLQIVGLGQHWFISYLLLCFLLTPVILPKWYEKFKGHRILVIMVLSQIVTIPFAILISFKVAFIWAYILGYIYGRDYHNVAESKSRKNANKSFYIIAILGVVARSIFCVIELDGIMDLLVRLLIQWIRIFEGGAIFIFVIQAFPAEKWETVNNTIKRVIYSLAQYSFEVFIVHEFFLHDIFTQFVPGKNWVKIIVAYSAIIIATFLLRKLMSFIKWRRVSDKSSVSR